MPEGHERKKNPISIQHKVKAIRQKKKISSTMEIQDEIGRF